MEGRGLRHDSEQQCAPVSLLSNRGDTVTGPCHANHLNTGAVFKYKGFPVNTKHLYNIRTMLGQRRRRWADVVQMLYKCFVLTGF